MYGVAPYRVRYLDGRERPLKGVGLILNDQDLREAWAPQRAGGAVELLDSENVVRDHGYTEPLLRELRLLPGSRVRHRKTGLTGTVYGLEWTRPDRLSPIPLSVEWDNQTAARHHLGWFASYQTPFTLEVIQ